MTDTARPTKDAWRSPIVGAALIILVTVVAYLPALRCGFIWDDDDHFTKNPAMLSVEGLKRIWSSLAVSRYYPLTLTTFWMEHRLWGLHPLPYHAVNIVLQAANAALLWTLLRRLRVPGAWFAAALWAVHPVGVESVAWATELKNIQSGFFFFLSVLCFLRFETDNKRGPYALAFAFGAAAMLSKPSTVVLPLVLLLCVWWERGGWRRGDLLRIAPFFGLALAMSAMTVVEQQRQVQRAHAVDWQLAPPERLVVAGKTVWFYAAHVLWPSNLMFIYPRWNISAGSVASWLPLAGIIILGALLWTCRRQPWARAALFGTGFFVVALLPVMGFFNVYFFRYSYVADHFQYLASIGLIGLAVGAGAAACQRAGQWGRSLGTFGVAIVLVMLGVFTWRRVCVFQNSESLWHDTLVKNPNAWMAHNNVGDALLKAGKVSEAVEQYEEALRIRPDLSQVHNNLGTALLQAGKLQEAIGHYEQGLRLEPNDAEAHNNLGLALEKTGKMPEAAWHYKEALRIKPNYPQALNNLAWLLATRPPTGSGDAFQAVALAERACKLTDNQSATYLDTLAATYAAAGRFDDAVGTAQKAIQVADSAAQTQLVSKIEMRLELYRNGQAYHQAADPAMPHPAH